MATSIIGRVVLFFIVLSITFWRIQGLYEDEVGKYDWRQRHVGKLKFVHFEPSSGKKSVFVATASNVLAALNTRTGDLTWRQVFTRGSTGVIDALHYKDDDLITVCGGGSRVHSWSTGTGFLKWESTVTEHKKSLTLSLICTQEDDVNVLALLVDNSLHALSTKTGEEKWSAKLSIEGNVQYKWISQLGDDVVIVGFVNNSHYNVQFYNLQDGTLSNENIFPAAWATVDSPCLIVSNGHMTCFDPISRELQSARLRDGNIFQRTPISGLVDQQTLDIAQLSLKPAATGLPLVILTLALDKQLLIRIEDDVKIIKQFTKETTLGTGDLPDNKIITSVTQTTGSEIEIRCFNAVDGTEIENMKQMVDIEKNHGRPKKVSVYLFHKKDQQLSYRVLLETADDAVTMIQQPGRVVWCREEGLASVAAVEMVDLPVSDTEAKFEDEFGGKTQIPVLEMFLRRLNTQFAQLKSYVAHLQRRYKHGSHHERATELSRVVISEDDDEEEYLTRDEFNLHKMIVIVSTSGKIYGIDSTDGSIFWSHFSPDLDVFHDGDTSRVALFIQRTTAHFPNPPQCTIVGRHKVSGMAFIFSLNPITGKATQDYEKSPSGKELDFKLKQLSMIGIMDSDFLKPILMLDDNNKVHLYPASAVSIIKKNPKSIFMYTAERETASLSGLSILATPDNSVEAQEVWRIKLPPTANRITGIYAKRSTEEVHSQGRVLGDRTVLYKYLNPNLVVVTTEGSDGPSKARLGVYLVDVVNGAIVFSVDHKRVEGPVHVVHSENWITYQYWNSKHRRAEITALELYEGKVQKNSTAFSSLDPPDSPLVERQSYILPSLVQSMGVSHTEKGITHKNIIMSLQAGGLVVLPKRLLDPRRPIEPLPEHREEGLIPYLPEIPLPYLSFINYNQSVFGIDGIYTTPAGLESTCLVMAYGLDYYYTRISPSKLFDVLNQDFDYLLIATVVVGLVVAAVITKKLAAIKALNQAWR